VIELYKVEFSVTSLAVYAVMRRALFEQPVLHIMLFMQYCLQFIGG
jgi:hypothetical protein